ncbi:MAG: hypothetical protein ABIR59_01495 [Gemmatimonadales bacterium]
MLRTLLPTLAIALGVPFAQACAPDTTTPQEQGPVLLSSAMTFSPWSQAINLELANPGAVAGFNTAYAEGCPLSSRDGKTLFIASNRPNGYGGLDIWISTREKTDQPWGEPVNAGEPVNSSSDDFCPTIDRDGHRFFFVSRRVVEGSCGGADIYETRMREQGGFDPVTNLGCEVNSAADEASPFPLPEAGSGPVLYFSSTRPGLGVGGDIYRSESRGNRFRTPQLVPGINSTFDDGQPNVRRDGLEIVFYSTRPDVDAQGGPDIYSATRSSTSAPWSTPVNLGPKVNSAAGDTRPSLSWDGLTLYFGSSRIGRKGSDIYVSTRDRL